VRKTKAKVPRAPNTEASKSSKASKAPSAQKEPPAQEPAAQEPPAREPTALEPPALASTPPATMALSDQEGNHSDDEIPSRQPPPVLSLDKLTRRQLAGLDKSDILDIHDGKKTSVRSRSKSQTPPS
jgi:hypothetical protein